MIAISPNQTLHCNHRLRPIRAHRLVSTIVQQNDVSAFRMNLPSNFALDHRCGGSVPVIAGHVPHHRFKPKLARNAQGRRTPSTKRRAKQIRMRSNRILQSPTAISQLAPCLRARLEDQQGMRKSVIADNVPRVCNRACNVRPFTHKAANHKERRMHVMFRQHLQQTQRMRVVRSIVEGQRQLPGSHLAGSHVVVSARARGEGAPKPLSGRRHRLVANCASRRRGRQSDKSRKHKGMILQKSRLMSHRNSGQIKQALRPVRFHSDQAQRSIERRDKTTSRAGHTLWANPALFACRM